MEKHITSIEYLQITNVIYEIGLATEIYVIITLKDILGKEIIITDGIPKEVIKQFESYVNTKPKVKVVTYDSKFKEREIIWEL